MTQVRVEGYVVGYDEVGGELLWTVKVNYSHSVHDGKKFKVHSLHPGTMLTKPSVDVSFRVEPVQVGQEQVLKAIDVAIGEIVSTVAPTTMESNNDDVISFYASEMGGDVGVVVTGLGSANEVRSDLEGSDDEHFVAYFEVPCTRPKLPAYTFPGELESSMDIVLALLGIDSTKDVLEYILTQVFVHGRNSQ